jgi:hypothetical protein
MKPLEPKGPWPQFATQRLRRFAEFNRNGKACAAEHRYHLSIASFASRSSWAATVICTSSASV